MNKLKTVCGLSTFFLLCACTQNGTVAVHDPAAVERTRWQLKQLNAEDGIDQQEAEVIARALCFTRVTNCNTPKAPELAGSWWISDTSQNSAELPGPTLHIESRSGKVVWGGDDQALSLQELIAHHSVD